MMEPVLTHAQMVIMEMMQPFVNHVQDIVKLVPDQLNSNVPNVIQVSMPNMIILMNVRTLVMLDISPTQKQRLVMNVTILVHAVLPMEKTLVLVVMEQEGYTKTHVLTHAQMVIIMKITFVPSVMSLVKLATDQTMTIVILVMKLLIYRMENVRILVILTTMKMKSITNVNHVTQLVKNVSLETVNLAKNVMMEHI